MEISWDVGSIWILKPRDQSSVLRVLIGPVVSEVWRCTSGCFATPCSAPVTAAITMVKDIIASTSHVIDNSICINSYANKSALLNHFTKLLTSSTSTSQLIGSWLIVEPPWIQLTTLWPFKAESGFGNWEYLNTHPTLLSKILTLLFDILMRPSKHLDNGTLLTLEVHI